MSIAYNEIIYSLFGVPENNDDRISTEEHFTDESILVDWLCLFLSLPSLGHLDATYMGWLKRTYE